jgi:hypothetical protein
LDYIFLDGIYGTKEPGWARTDDYQIVIFMGCGVMAARVEHAVFCMQIFVLPVRFQGII